MSSRLSAFEGLLAILLLFLLAIAVIVAGDVFLRQGNLPVPPAFATLLVEASATPSLTGVSTRTHTVTLTETATSTPFQPLPTDTPTLTATVTLTPSLTPTETLTATPRPTRKPTRKPKPSRTPIPEPPESAQITGVVGRAQLYNLDCEARSAVDLAAFYGIRIDIHDFLNNLPSSDDPDSGFVGNYRDERGMLPPNSYGVHAGPVAELLREYGLDAHARKGMEWREMQTRIAAGDPVIAWVVGNVWPGTGFSYTASNGNTTTVTPFEHTVIVVGYDAESVAVVDGSLYYIRSLDEFLASWRVLDYMAVVVGD